MANEQKTECMATLDCKKELNDIKVAIKDLHDKLFIGNSTPSIIVQIDRLNVFKKLMCWLGSILTIAVCALVVRLLYGMLS